MGGCKHRAEYHTKVRTVGIIMLYILQLNYLYRAFSPVWWSRNQRDQIQNNYPRKLFAHRQTGIYILPIFFPPPFVRTSLTPHSATRGSLIFTAIAVMCQGMDSKQNWFFDGPTGLRPRSIYLVITQTRGWTQSAKPLNKVKIYFTRPSTLRLLYRSMTWPSWHAFNITSFVLEEIHS